MLGISCELLIKLKLPKNNKSADANNIPRQKFKSILASKSKVKNEVKGHTPKKAYLHPLKDVCMQYEKKSSKLFSEISWGKWTYHPPSIKTNNRLKIEGKKLGQRLQPPKGTSTPPEGCVYAIWK